MKKRAEMPPAFTLLSSFRDIFEIAKSNYIAGYEIRSIINRVANHLRKFSMYYIFLIIVVAFGVATSWKNLESDSVANVIQSNIYILVIGLGMLLVIVLGAIDLSVGSLVTFSGVLAVYSYNQFGGNLGIAIVITLLFGLGFGLFQGFLIGYFKMPSFVVTLGGMLLFSGLALVVTNGQTLQPLGVNADSFKDWVNGSFEIANIGGVESFHYASFFIIFCLGLVVAVLMFFGRMKRVKYGIDTGNFLSFMMKIGFVLGLFAVVAYFIADSIFGIKYYMIYLLVLIVLITFVTQNTTFGRGIYAIGGNKRAAFLSGINVARTQTLVFGIVGMLSAFAGLIVSGINNYATASIGSGYELDVISSVFVGGASMTGGIGTVAGTVIGGMALGFIQNGLLLLNFADAIQRVVKAVILIAAVGYDVYNHRKIG